MFNVKGKPESLAQEILPRKNALVRGFGKVLCKPSGNTVPSALQYMYVRAKEGSNQSLTVVPWATRPRPCIQRTGKS
jgi:hypothetical protein